MPYERTRKPSIKWVGPYRVVECRSDYIYLLEDLINGKKWEVHGRRLKFFRNKDYQVEEEVLNHLAYQAGELLVVDSFTDIRQDHCVIEIRVKWRGFAEEESDSVTLSSLREDVPYLVNEYIQDIQSTATVRQCTVTKSA